MSEERFTWTDFYMKFADKLREYRDDRSDLIEKVKRAYDSIGMKLPKLDSDGIPTDIDPYTVFGLFNKGITDANRRKIIGALAEEFGVEAAQPDDFDGIPALDNRNATFYAFTNDARRGEDDIDNLWRMFEAQIELAAEDSEENRKAFVRAYDATVSQFGLGWKLTMGLHWVRPFTFINMDSRNRWFLGNEAQGGQAIAQVFPKKNSPAPDGKTYLLICYTVDSQLGTEACPPDSFPALSHAAFVESERVNREEREKEKKLLQEAEEDALGDEGVEAVTEDAETVRYWLYAPGETAFMYNNLLIHQFQTLQIIIAYNFHVGR